MQEEHRQAIQKNFSSLVEQTDLDLIVSILYEKGVFSEAMIEPYRDIHKDVRTRKRQLYRDIERRGPAAFGCLIEALTETGHWNLVRALDPTSGLHPRPAPGPGPSPHPSLPQLPQKSQFVSLMKKNKEMPKTDLESQQSTSASKIPYPLDFSKPDEASAEIPNFHVVKSTKFHEQTETGLPLYPTRSRQRGVLIAFSFMEFRNNMEEHRRGAEVDCKNLKYLFDEMGFRNLFYNNLTKDETESTLEALKKIKELKKTECVFVVVSSHGYERRDTSDTDIRCTDGRLISIRSIIEQFNNKNFPHLRDIPKVFIFQTCRGSSEEHILLAPRPLAAPRARVQTDGSARAPPREETPAPARAPLGPDRLYSDILIAHSTLPGFVSRRDAEKGSWYIQALCRVFAARAHDCDVERLFTLVDTELHARFHSQTSSIDRWGFNQLLYLHPGLFDD